MCYEPAEELSIQGGKQFGGIYRVVFMLSLSLLISGEAIAQSGNKSLSEKEPHASLTPKYVFSDKYEEQEDELKKNPLITRFAKSREALSSAVFRPTYHFVSPEGGLNDPNGLSFWQGRWHLFYQAYPSEYSPRPEDVGKPRRAWAVAHWGHAVSDDLVHWRDLPYAIYPGVEYAVYSGGTVVEADRVVAFYPGVGVGQMLATSHDPLLLNWEKKGPVKTDVGDSHIWKEGDTYFGVISGFGIMKKYYPDSKVPLESNSELGGLFGKAFGVGVWPKFALWSSKDLMSWKKQGELLAENTPFTDRYDDGSCPSFLKIGDKYILLNFSHKNGGQYMLGDYDAKKHKFRPYDYGRFNHGQVGLGNVHAPSAASDGKGGVINILNLHEGMQSNDSDGIMSLPQRLTLGEDKKIRIAPVEAIATLRGAHANVGGADIPVDRDIVLDAIHGNTMELNVEIDPKDSRWVRLNILRSPGGEEQTAITFYNTRKTDPLFSNGRVDEEIVLDAANSSILPDAWPRPPEKAIVRRGNENLKLRVFIDRSVVEVFVNSQQYLAMRVYPGRKDSLGVSLRAHGRPAELKNLDAWQVNPIWPVAVSPVWPVAKTDN